MYLLTTKMAILYELYFEIYRKIMLNITVQSQQFAKQIDVSRDCE